MQMEPIVNTSISEKIYEAGQKLISSEAGLSLDFNKTINAFLSWPFNAVSGSVIDSNNLKTNTFNTIIQTILTEDQESKNAEAPADTVACIIDTQDAIDLESFRISYNRIAHAKKLKKSKLPPTDSGTRNETLGIILAATSTVSLEDLAGELQCLNQQTPSSQWPDVIAILSQGTINYAVQFPGEQKLNSFMLPSHDIVATSAPAIYVIPVMTPAGLHTFNKLCSLIFAHLVTFSPSTKLPDFNEILINSPRISLTLAGYQFNLMGELLPVPPQFYKSRYLAPPPQVFKDKQHDISYTLQLLPWQDGKVIVLRGQIPLQALLIYLGDKIRNRSSTVSRNNLQISSILPISETDYIDMLQKIQRQTSFKMQKPESKIIKGKFSEEGASSPFMARLFIGVLTLRDAAIQEEVHRDKFDDIYHPIIMKLCSIKETLEDIIKLFSQHAEKIAQGKIVQVDDHSVHINEPINRRLKKHVESFICDAERILKHGMQRLTKTFNIDIGFLFRQPNAFQNGIKALKISEPELTNYIEETRTWSERLINTRIDIEHNLWQLPDVQYSHTSTSSQMNVEEPKISDEPVTKFLNFIFDRLICFVEDVTTHCLQKKMPAEISFSEIPLGQRQSEMPVRFRVALVNNKNRPWSINYTPIPFEKI